MSISPLSNTGSTGNTSEAWSNGGIAAAITALGVGIIGAFGTYYASQHNWRIGPIDLKEYFPQLFGEAAQVILDDEQEPADRLLEDEALTASSSSEAASSSTSSLSIGDINYLDGQILLSNGEVWQLNQTDSDPLANWDQGDELALDTESGTLRNITRDSAVSVMMNPMAEVENDQLVQTLGYCTIASIRGDTKTLVIDSGQAKESLKAENFGPKFSGFPVNWTVGTQLKICERPDKTTYITDAIESPASERIEFSIPESADDDE